MKDTLPYFSHDNNARRHPKMKALIVEFGYEGYGRFWALNERIAETSGAFIDISRKVNKLDLASELGLDSEGLDKFLTFLSDPEIDLININNDKITTDRINELFTTAMDAREKARDKKQKKGKQESSDGKDEFPYGKQESSDGKITDKIREDKTKQEETKQDNENEKPTDLSEPKNLFMNYWQHNPDIFNITAGFDDFKKWQRYWATSPPTCEQVKRAFENFIADVKSGDIERRYIPSKPDLFIAGNWINTCQERRKKQKIAADRIPPENTSQYFTEASDFLKTEAV